MPARLPYHAHARALLVLGLPLIGSHVAQMALHVTDTVMLGWYGVLPLAAGVLGASSFFLLFMLGSGFAHAVMPLVAAAMGAGDETRVRRDTRMGLWLSIGYGAAIYPVFWFSGPLLLALGQDAQVSALAQDYLRIAGLGMVPALMVMVLRSWLSALEHTRVVLAVTLLGVAVNAALNWALIFGNWGAPELGLAGAAVASVLVQVVTLVAVAGYGALHPGLRRFRILQRLWRPDWPAMRLVFRLGWPIGLTSLMEGGLFHAAALMMGWIGTVELAAHGIALEITAVTFMIHVGLSNAATIRTGRAEGEGDARALRDGAAVALVLSQGIGLFIIATFVLAPEPLIRLFLDMGDPDAGRIVAYGSLLLLCAAAFQVADAAQVMALGLLRGIRDTRVPMLIAALCYWVIGIPASYGMAFGLGWGGVGLWLGLVLGLSLTAAALLVRFWMRAPRVA
ncbi:MAG: MATE family efflux transporter [Gemmobacter sp.]|uniref:MATE family efflux transporter n=1 Tax=Gemmobacter sp. TaxID=1898957 RepID=UPI00391DCCFF